MKDCSNCYPIGFDFLTYKEVCIMEEILNNPPHEINERIAETKRKKTIH